MGRRRAGEVSSPEGTGKLLAPLGFTGRLAEWITLVCLLSGLFTGDQAGAFLRLTRRTAQRFVQALLAARVSGRRVEVVAVAWEQPLLERAGRVLTSWRWRAMTEAEQEAIMLRQAIYEADWEALEPYGGLDATMRMIHQYKQQNPNFNGPGMIDRFRLWGSRRCRQMGRHLFDGGVSV